MRYEVREKIDGLINQKDLGKLNDILDSIIDDLYDNEGFEFAEIKEYLTEIIIEKIGK
jgi:hypothetical protein